MNACRHKPVSASHNRAVLSKDALWGSKGEREERKAVLTKDPRGDKLMAFGNLRRTPAYSSDPVSVTLE